MLAMLEEEEEEVGVGEGREAGGLSLFTATMRSLEKRKASPLVSSGTKR